jgi:EmrB/QacA subfamily drug resistance transporter
MSPPPSEKALLPWLAAVALFMESLDTTILQNAIPVMAGSLGVPPLSLKSVLSCYTLGLAVFIPVSGWMAERFGTRQVFIGAVSVFTLSSVLCGLSSTVPALIAFRILQGCGGAMMMPVARVALVRAFPKSELVRVLNLVGIAAVIGPMLGPLAGGLIVHYLHWRLTFWINLPVGLVTIYLLWRHVGDHRAARPPALDWRGFLLFGGSAGTLAYVVELFREDRWGTGQDLALLAVSLVLMVLYARHARRAPAPILRLSLLALRTLRVTVRGAFLTRLGLAGVPFLLSLLFQVSLGQTPVGAALMVLPLPLASMATKNWIPRVLARFGFRRTLMAATALSGGLIASLAAVGPSTPIPFILLLGACLGFSNSLINTSLASLAYADTSEADSGMAATLISTSHQLSVSFGVVAASLLASAFLPPALRADPAELIHGLHRAFLVLGAWTAACAVQYAELQPEDGQRVSGQQLSRAA